jgi:hypothetical protein
LGDFEVTAKAKVDQQFAGYPKVLRIDVTVTNKGSRPTEFFFLKEGGAATLANEHGNQFAQLSSNHPDTFGIMSNPTVTPGKSASYPLLFSPDQLDKGRTLTLAFLGAVLDIDATSIPR